MHHQGKKKLRGGDFNFQPAEEVWRNLNGGDIPDHEILPNSTNNARVSFATNLAPRWFQQPAEGILCLVSLFAG